MRQPVVRVGIRPGLRRAFRAARASRASCAAPASRGFCAAPALRAPSARLRKPRPCA